MGDLTGWKLVPVEPTPEMIDRGVAFALNVKISRDYRWTEYVSDLYGRMLSAAPSPTLPSRDDHIVDVDKMVMSNKDQLRDLLLTFGEFGANAGRERRNAEECASAILSLFTASQPLSETMRSVDPTPAGGR